ncbi:MAG: radical SAM family heme chaperone HemW [Victivallaceae bacterium]|nr:radical SAM family heme chaperone HemW [Victivallaceae bacterium]
MDYENIYIHIPFCKRKCAYCGFYSEADPSPARIEAFLDKLEGKLAVLGQSTPVNTLFLGGGTPSLLSPQQLQRLQTMVEKYLPLAAGAEVSIECNPENFGPERLEVIRPFANRISIGVQAFSDSFLTALGRASSRKQIEQALHLAKEFNFNNLSIDLIYGIPGQTRKSWLANLELAVKSDIKHISCYSLTVEEGSELDNRIENFTPVENDETAEMWLQTGDFLSKKGFSRYEVSNYSCPGAECRHNVNIWHGQTYLGLGPAASSFDGANRWTEPASLNDWLADKEPERDIIEPEYRLIEIFIIGLRTVEGWTRDYWEKIPLQQTMNVEWQTMVQKALKVKKLYPDLLEVTPGSIHLTQQGLLFWNTIAEAWLE